MKKTYEANIVVDRYPNKLYSMEKGFPQTK